MATTRQNLHFQDVNFGYAFSVVISDHMIGLPDQCQNPKRPESVTSLETCQVVSEDGASLSEDGDSHVGPQEFIDGSATACTEEDEEDLRASL